MDARCKTNAAPKLNRLGLWQGEINLTVRLPLTVREELATVAVRMGLPSSSQLVRKILTDWLVREGSR